MHHILEWIVFVFHKWSYRPNQTKSLILKCWLVHTLMCILLLDHFLWLKCILALHTCFFNFHLWLLIVKCHFVSLLFEIEISQYIERVQTAADHHNDCKNLPVSAAGRKQETEKKGIRESGKGTGQKLQCVRVHGEGFMSLSCFWLLHSHTLRMWSDESLFTLPLYLNAFYNALLIEWFMPSHSVLHMSAHIQNAQGFPRPHTQTCTNTVQAFM